MTIAVAGTGYVGLSIATLLASRNGAIAVDVILEKVKKINRGICQFKMSISEILGRIETR